MCRPARQPDRIRSRPWGNGHGRGPGPGPSSGLASRHITLPSPAGQCADRRIARSGRRRSWPRRGSRGAANEVARGRAGAAHAGGGGAKLQQRSRAISPQVERITDRPDGRPREIGPPARRRRRHRNIGAGQLRREAPRRHRLVLPPPPPPPPPNHTLHTHTHTHTHTSNPL